MLKSLKTLLKRHQTVVTRGIAPSAPWLYPAGKRTTDQGKCLTRKAQRPCPTVAGTAPDLDRLSSSPPAPYPAAMAEPRSKPCQEEALRLGAPDTCCRWSETSR